MVKLTNNAIRNTKSGSCSNISMRTFSLTEYNLRTHKCPVSEGKILRQRVEGYVATWALRVMVWT